MPRARPLPKHSLSDAIRMRAADAALPFALRAEFEAVAAELDRLARFEDRVRYLVIRTIDSDKISEINAALDELQDWALGRAPLQGTGAPDP